MAAPDDPRSFATTRWSVVLAAGNRSTKDGAQALADLCAGYWYPLYAFIRRRVGDEHEARDLTQEFFTRLLEKDFLTTAQPERGRFRAFLITAARNFLVNEWDKSRAVKRGGGKSPLALDFTWGEERFHREPADPWTPERLFERQWTLLLLEQVLTSLRATYKAKGKVALFEQLKPFLTAEPDAGNYAAAAETLGLRPGAVKVAVHRLRQRYREHLRDEVANTVAEPGEIDEEIRQLFRSLES